MIRRKPKQIAGPLDAELRAYFETLRASYAEGAAGCDAVLRGEHDKGRNLLLKSHGALVEAMRMSGAQ